jgi:5-methylthioribose kinase
LTTLYAGDRLSSADLDELAEYLNALHSLGIGEDQRRVFRNRDMRALNHAHQFDIPLRSGNGLQLDRFTPGLEALAAEMLRDHAYCARVEELGRMYLADGPTLLHGDFFPGSWLRTALGLSIIDPEFCFAGWPEYDLGILTAHLLFTAHEDLLAGLRARYGSAADWSLVDGFAGVELMRRLIGVAQLPLAAGLNQKRAWLEQSRRLVCG